MIQTKKTILNLLMLGSNMMKNYSHLLIYLSKVSLIMNYQKNYNKKMKNLKKMITKKRMISKKKKKNKKKITKTKKNNRNKMKNNKRKKPFLKLKKTILLRGCKF